MSILLVPVVLIYLLFVVGVLRHMVLWRKRLLWPVRRRPRQVWERGWCVRHGVPMTLRHGKDGSRWHSHKTATGWCKGR